MHLEPINGSGTPVPDPSINQPRVERAEEEAARDAPKKMAIIGMSCRLPGEVTTPDELWELCSRARSAWSPMPKSRFNAEAFYHPNQDRPGSFNPTGAHFLHEDVGLFDAPFFNITLQEARSMDPQHRIMLECVYEALENAGISNHSVTGKDIGVFAGASFPDYEVNNTKDAESIPMYDSTGTSVALQSNRISYYFNLHGPSITVDTACSSSLTALHLAAQSIRNGECSMAVVGGCHLNLVPEMFISMTRSRLLADSGKSYAFDNRGTGFGRGEGAGCIVLKSLEDAQTAEDAIRGVIVNTGINQDGRTRGIAMPNGEAQEALIRAVYKEAKVDPANTGFVEAHGTGTKVGDPLEATALNAVFGKGRTPKQPLLIGSIKSNMGHLEGSSGIVAVIKTALMLERGFVLPNCNYNKTNEEIPMDQWNMKVGYALPEWLYDLHANFEKVPKKLQPWPRGKSYASVNNFGFGGTNAHVIMERAPRHQGEGAENTDPLKRKVFVASGNDKKAALDTIKQLATYMDLNPVIFNDSLMDNLAYTLGQRRSFHPWRVAVASSHNSDLSASWAKIPEPVRSMREPSIGFVFTGQGAQWHGMGKELLATYPIFRRTMEDVDTCLKTLGSTFSIIDELLLEDATASRISAAYMSQPACTAVQLALVDLLSSWGIHPKAVVGHSSGEIAAAYAAGVLTLEECVRVAYCRGVAANIVANDDSVQGAMLAVGANARDIQQILDAIRGKRAVIACENSPTSVTLSGDKDVISNLQVALDKEGIFTRMLHVDVAYHSHHMQRVSQQYRSLLGKIAPRPSRVSFHSTVYGKLVPGSMLDVSYWVENLVSRVEFVKGVQSLLDIEEPTGQIDTLVEIGPHPALQTPTKDIVNTHAPTRSMQFGHTLKRKTDAIEAVQQLAISLFTSGMMTLNFQEINFPNLSTSQRKPALLTNLPKYPWNHSEKYWINARLCDNLYRPQFARNDILGKLCIENIDFEPRWRNIIRADDHPWIRQHRVHDSNIYPMTGFLAMAMEAISQQAQLHNLVPGKIDLRDIFISRVLAIPDTATVETMLSLRPVRSDAPGRAILGWHEFKVFSWTEGRGWDQHVSGFVMVQESKEANPVSGSREELELTRKLQDTIQAINSSCNVTVETESLYKDISGSGIHYGPIFQGLKNISASSQQAVATVDIPNTKECMPNEHETNCIIHPVTLDLCSQTMWILQGFGQPGQHVAAVPSHVKHVSVSLKHPLCSGSTLQLYGTQLQAESASKAPTNRIFATHSDDPSKVAVEISGLTLVPISNDMKGSKDNSPSQICYKLHWEPCFEFLSEDTYLQLPRPDVDDDGKGSQRMYQLDRVAENWLRRMLRAVPEDQVAALPHHQQRFYRWAQQTCKDAKESEDLSEEIINQTLKSNGAGAFNCKVGEMLPNILRGEADALTVMLEDDLLSRYYEDLDGLREAYANASICIDKMAHQNCDMNILEIGAGTGGATLPILKSLGGNEPGLTPRFGHYTYTDISPGFFEKAKTKFEDWGHLMTYQTLDVSADPVGQGFELGSYDMVIACNVLHATPQINETMANIRSLLKPGGKVMLIEETASKPRHFPFALLPGWWLASDEVRPDGPLLTREGWNDVMKANDFSGVDLCVEEYPGASFQSGCLIMSTANGPVGGPTNPGDILIIGSDNIGSLSLLSLESGLSAATGVKPTVVSDLKLVDVTGKWCIFLGGMDQSLLSHLTPEKFQEFQRLMSRARGLLWTVRHTLSYRQSLGGNMAVGLARTVRSETGVPFATLDLGEKESMPDADAVRHVLDVFQGVFCKRSQLMQSDMEFVIRDGHVCVPRLIDNHPLNLSVQQETADAPPALQPFKQADRPLRLTAGDSRTLDEMYFTDDDARNDPLPEDYVEIRVTCTGLNFRDVLMAMGQLRGDKLGQECSGVVSKVGSAVTNFATGDRVCAMSPGSLATYTRCPASCAWVIPDDMSFEIAASIPAVFCTAYYSLVDLGRLSEGESVLIHAAAGGVGQAAIIIAQSIGAKIFATVGSVDKKRFLMQTYNLKEDQIFFSRDTSFADGIRRSTGGEGVDVALNSLSGDALQATFECIAPFGRFIELGKRDITSNSRLEMSHFNENVSFASVDLGIVREKRPKLLKRLFRNSFQIFGDARAYSRWPVTTLPISELEAGFRALQGGQVIGKMVVSITDDSKVKVYPARKEEKLLRPDATYIVVGGTSGIGLDIASWMPEKGARHIVLVSRSGVTTELAQTTVSDLEKMGVTVDVCRCDISSQQSVEENLSPLLSKLPPARGVVYGAMVLRDMLFEKQSFDDYETVMKPRVHGIWNLQTTLQNLEKGNLDFFITLSSAASFVGNMGQAAYAASGTFMAALAQYSRASNIPCTTIDLPVVRGIGYLSDDQKREQISSQLGTESVCASEIRGLVAAAMRKEMIDTCAGHCVVGFDGVKKYPASEQPFWVNDTKLSHLLRLSTLAGAGNLADAVQSSTEISPASAIRQSRSRESAQAVTVTALTHKISSILMRPIEEMDPLAPISVYGLDSLVAIEIRNWITRELEANLQILEILTSDSLPALAEHILKKSGILTPEAKSEWGLDVAEVRNGVE